MPQVVIVDDDAGFVETLGPHFTRQGYAVVPECTVSSALRYLGGSTPDALITDVRIGSSSGWDLVRFARRAQPDLSIVVITGYPDSFTEAEALRLGVPVFLKPFEPDHLLDYIRYRLPAREVEWDPVDVLSSLTNGPHVHLYSDLHESGEYLVRTVFSRGCDHLQIRRRHTHLRLSFVSQSRQSQQLVAFPDAAGLTRFQDALMRHLQHTGWTVVESDIRH
jgi:ActR/RegA family two-component response regulator